MHARTHARTHTQANTHTHVCLTILQMWRTEACVKATGKVITHAQVHLYNAHAHAHTSERLQTNTYAKPQATIIHSTLIPKCGTTHDGSAAEQQQQQQPFVEHDDVKEGKEADTKTLWVTVFKCFYCGKHGHNLPKCRQCSQAYYCNASEVRPNFGGLGCHIPAQTWVQRLRVVSAGVRCMYVLLDPKSVPAHTQYECALCAILLHLQKVLLHICFM